MMMNKLLKNIVRIVVLLIAAVAVYVYAMYNKPHVDVAKKPANITLVPQSLLSDFENDEEQANLKYVDKIIQVSGVISELKVSDGKAIIVMESEDSMGSILFHLSSNEIKKANALQEGQKVTIKGICTGYLMDVILVKCILIN